jgi:hypothetical protein
VRGLGSVADGGSFVRDGTRRGSFGVDVGSQNATLRVSFDRRRCGQEVSLGMS